MQQCLRANKAERRRRWNRMAIDPFFAWLRHRPVHCHCGQSSLRMRSSRLSSLFSAAFLASRLSRRFNVLLAEMSILNSELGLVPCTASSLDAYSTPKALRSADVFGLQITTEVEEIAPDLRPAFECGKSRMELNRRTAEPQNRRTAEPHVVFQRTGPGASWVRLLDVAECATTFGLLPQGQLSKAHLAHLAHLPHLAHLALVFSMRSGSLARPPGRRCWHQRTAPRVRLLQVLDRCWSLSQPSDDCNNMQQLRMRREKEMKER